MKKIIILFILILSLTGCKDYVEINDLAILTGIVIDYKDNMYEVTAQLIVNDKDSNIEVFKTTSNSINEAIAELSKLSNKEIFISHLKVLIVTDTVIKENIDFKDYFLRSSKSKMNFYVYVINNEISEKVLNVYKKNDGSSIYLEKIMKFNQNIFSSSTPLKFSDYAYYTYEKGYNLIYPKIKIVKNNMYYLVPYESVKMSGLIKCYKVDKVFIKEFGEVKNVLVGITDDKLKYNGINCILNYLIMEG